MLDRRVYFALALDVGFHGGGFRDYRVPAGSLDCNSFVKYRYSLGVNTKDNGLYIW